jgi:hypothetical protein
MRLSAGHALLPQALADNADLSGRLIDAALEASESAFEGSAAAAAAPAQRGGSLTSVPLGRWTQAEAQRRQSKAKAEVGTALLAVFGNPNAD